MRGAPPITHPKGREFLDAAIRYAQLGFRVIPLKERSKEPLIADWPNKATTDEATIRGWWAKWPKANVGIATGRYGDGYFCVLDFDPRNGGDWYGDVGRETLPPTWVVHTGGGGRHYYYKTPYSLRGRKLKDGVDLKGEGGYVVAPPSIHPEGGAYVWEVGAAPGDMPIGGVPEWVLREAAGEGAPENGAVGRRPSLWRMPPPIPKGMRHDYLVSLAGALWGAGVRESEVEAVLWRALELFETREDFDPETEIGGIVKGLKTWEGEGLDLAIVLRSLPKAVRAIVMREVPAAKGAAAKAGEGEKRSAIMAKAAEVVAKLEVRQKEDGTACYVYRPPDGREREVPCTPAGVRQLLQELGIRIEQKDTEKLLRIVADAGDEGENKKRREKPKAAGLEEILEVVWRYKWFEWNGATWVLEPPLISIATLEKVHEILLQNRVEISKERLNTFFDKLMKFLPVSPMEGVVVTEAPRYGRAGGLRGVWFRQKGDLYVVTPTEIKHFPFGQWPEDVYVLDLRQRESPIDLNGTQTDLLVYWEGVGNRLEVDKRVALAMYLPVLLDQGHIGLILRGPAEAGKSTLSKSLGYLRLGREPETPHGGTTRDLLAILHNEVVVHFDEVGDITPEFQTILKSMITGNKRQMRSLYTNLDKVTGSLKGSAIFCTTRLERLESELRTRCFVWDLEAEGAGDFEGDILDFCKLLSRRALGGALKLYQQAAKLPRPPKNLLPELRFRDWLSWAYRYAQVLGVADKFVAYVRKSKIAAHRGEKFEFLIDVVSNPQFDPRKEYTITDLIALAEPSGGSLSWVPKALNKEGSRADLIALARSLGYRLRIEKKRQKGDNKAKLYFLFTPVATGGSDRLRRLLQSVGIEPDWEPDWDGEAAPSAEPLPQDGHAPIPEVHTPPPAPEIAPPSPEPVPMAAKNSPAPKNTLLDLPRSLSEVKQAVRKAPPAPEPEPIAAKGAPAEGGGGPEVVPLPQLVADYLKASRELQEKIPDVGGAPKEPELFLVIVETARAVEKLGELFTLLREREGDNIKTLTWGYRVLRACMFGHLGTLRGLATLRGHSLELLPHPKVGWAVARRVLQELEGVLNGEEVSLWPLPKLRKAPTDPEPTPPPIEPEPKWREAWELFAQIPPDHPTWLAILKGLDPDPLLDWEYHTKHRLIRALLNGEAIEPPSKPPKNP
jgi:hypothetical protein